MVDFKVRYVIGADNRQAKQAFQEIDALQKKGLGSRGGGQGSGVADVFGGTIAAEAVTRLTSVLTDGGRAVFDYTSNLEQARIAMGTLMGSTAEANKHIAELMRLSRATPLDFGAIAKMSQRLQGAGVEAKGLTALIKDIGNIAAATGELTAERMEGIGVAISQVFSKGKVSAEEMEQLAERGVPAWRILSQQLNISTGEARKLAEQGKITSQQFIDAFQKFSRMNYGDAMEKQAATFSGAMGKITNILLQTANTAFQPIFDKISTFADDVADSLSEQEAKAGLAGVSFGEAIGQGIGEGIRRSGGLDMDNWFDYYPGKMAFDLGWSIAKGIDQGMKSFDDTMTDPSGRKMRLDPNTMTMVPVTPDGPTVKAPPPGAYNADDAAKKAEREAEKRRKEAERLAERDLQAAIRIEEMNFSTIKDQFSQQFDELRRVFRENGSVGEFFGGMTAAMERYKSAVGDSLKFLEELENRGRSAMTEHEQALLTAQQQERRNEIVRQGEEESRQNNEELLRIQESMADLVIARYEKEKAIADEVERQAEAFREIRRSMLMMPGMDASGQPNAQAPHDVPGGFSPFEEGLFGEGGLDVIRGEALELEAIYRDMGSMVSDVTGQMAAGVGALVEAWVLYGELGPGAVRKMVAAVLAGVAAEAAVKAVFQLAEGFAMLFINPGAAAAHFKAAALYGAVAVGAAVAGRAIAGDSFKDKGSGSSSSSGASRSSGGDMTPISRQNENTFISGRNGVITEQRAMVSVLEKIEAKISSMRPGDVVTAGAKQAPNAIASATVEGIKKNSAIGTNLRRVTGGR